MDEFKSMFQETAAEEGGFALIEPGEYEAKLMDCKLDLTKSPARLTVVYELTEEPNQGKKLFGNYQLEGRGIGFLKKDLQTLGMDFSQVGSPEDIASLFWDNMPLPVVVFVNQKEWNGKTYNNVYLNSILDKPAVHTAAKAPMNQKEATRQAAQKTAPPTQTKAKAPLAGKAKVTHPAGEPSFDDSNSEIPF